MFGFEVCPTTGTKHIQGYIYFQHPREWNGVKRFLCTNPISLEQSGSPRFEIARGTAIANREYCTKEDSADPDFAGPRAWSDCSGEYNWPAHWEEYGDINQCPIKGQGKRSDGIAFCEAVLSGTDVRSAATNKDMEFLSYFVKYPKGYDRLREAISVHRSQPPEIYWLFGATGTGKSRWAQASYPSAYRYCKIGGSTVWWDGYDNHNEVIVDDVRADTFSFDYLLQLTDRYPFQGAIKGGDVKLNFNVLVFTAPFHWKEMFANTVAECVNQLGRRVTKTYKVTDWPTVEMEEITEYELQHA